MKLSSALRYQTYAVYVLSSRREEVPCSKKQETSIVLHILILTFLGRKSRGTEY
jgi:hypothetical protein